MGNEVGEVDDESDHGGACVLSYRIIQKVVGIARGFQQKKDVVRVRFASQKEQFGNCELDGLEGGANRRQGDQ